VIGPMSPIGLMELPGLPNRSQDFGGVLDAVAVALLGEEELAVMGKLQLARVAGHERVKMGEVAVRLGTQDAAQTLRFLLARTERAGHLNEHIGIRQIDGEIPHLRQNELPNLALAKSAVQVFAVGAAGLARDQRNVEPLLQKPQLLQVLTD